MNVCNFFKFYPFWMPRHALERSRSETLNSDEFFFQFSFKKYFTTPNSIIVSQSIGNTFSVEQYRLISLRWFRKHLFCGQLILSFGYHTSYGKFTCKENFRSESKVTTFHVDNSAPSHPGLVQTIPKRYVYTPGGLRGFLEA